MSVALLFVLFILVPIAELFVIVQVGQTIGVAETIVLLLLVSILGAWLAKREGLGVLRRVRQQLDAGRLPAAEVIDGFLVLLAARAAARARLPHRHRRDLPADPDDARGRAGAAAPPVPRQDRPDPRAGLDPAAPARRRRVR